MVTGLLAIGALLKENSPRKIAKLYFINCKHIRTVNIFYSSSGTLAHKLLSA